MRKVLSDKVERARQRDGAYASNTGDPFGRAILFHNPTRAHLMMLWSDGSEEVRWEHVSVTVPGVKRCPTWEEMAWVKSLFWEEEENVMQLHPQRSAYVNVHPYCLHLWKPLDVEIPLPPTSAVGPVTG